MAKVTSGGPDVGIGRWTGSDAGTHRASQFFEVTPFAIHLTPELVVRAARTLDDESELETPSEKEEKP